MIVLYMYILIAILTASFSSFFGGRLFESCVIGILWPVYSLFIFTAIFFVLIELVCDKKKKDIIKNI
jgi:uncharacterized membrane protein (DUF485 family)